MAETYEFRWSNIDLPRYLRGRRFLAEQKRNEAEALRRDADMIDNEANALEDALRRVEPEAGAAS